MEKKTSIKLKDYYLFWSSQSLSMLGSSMTSFALTLWLYEKTGSSLSTAGLTICTYLPYCLMSIFSGAISDKYDKKKTIFITDLLAALSTLVVFILYKTNHLLPYHLYIINIFAGLMNSIQEPCSEVCSTLLVPKEYYQKTSGLKSLTRSTIQIFNPILASSLFALKGLDFVIYFDIFSFLVAIITFEFFIKVPKIEKKSEEGVLSLIKEGFDYLKTNPLIFRLIIFMSGVNLISSAFDAALPGFIMPNPKGGELVFGMVSACAGIAMIIGSLIVSIMPKPQNRVRVVYLTMLLSLGSENFILSLAKTPFVWCLAQIIGWVFVPIMSANLEVILRNSIPLELQGRIYACRNCFQFITIPIGLFLGGFMVDELFEPLMNKNTSLILHNLFGYGKGSGAALTIFILGVLGIIITLISGRLLKGYEYKEK